MQEAAGKANGLAATLMSENSERVEQKAENQERAAARSNRLNEVFHSGWLETFHGMIPKSIAAR